MSFAELEALIPRRDTELNLVWKQETVYSNLIQDSTDSILGIFKQTYREFDDLFTVCIRRVLQPQTAAQSK